MCQMIFTSDQVFFDKICARDFWKGRGCYRKLQEAYFKHVKSKGFYLRKRYVC